MKKIYIPNPCSEIWETMASHEQGKFCSVCSKCVIDFTEKKSEEIESVFKEKRDEDICGRFFSYQLDKDVEKSEKLKSRFLKYIPRNFQNSRMTLAAFSLVLFLVGSAKPKEKDHAVIGEAKIEEDSIPKNDDYILGAPVLRNDSVAKMPQKDSLKFNQNK
ncbi:hypothetical protein JET18_01820 [Chryseobacterium sp. L7]|uniref:Uncharacterized protein n=1 Tax=Chryseobacterium endalhagicum TaxID=2797638 RepID=A0ABS1QCD9_9FLAO|nr:hypothetical protein [Chryseobacterium endalhagicum]MBL1219553.1 hypothetical protein [Chryseobacterium endalhagicum]